MQEFKGTKGSWRVSRDFDEVTTSNKGILEGSKRVCKIATGFKKSSEIVANAKLIASAPEMLETLKEIREWYEKNQAEYLGEITPICFSKALSVIQKAIG